MIVFLKAGGIKKDMFHSFMSIVINAVFQLISLVGIILAAGFLLDFFEKKSVQLLYRTFGRKGYLFTAWVGTPVHYEKL
ncbi:hypothetical protein BTO30_15335 [Domibacillus antri]|uniref:Uncharacterized protein n=1 Tax=Domibacillus antri TaxID=1714264 RepID=A0A1Q8Q208_9BACI|nr:hypothetical protein [Domibacillus antri]OLN21369.1 hypothetical protein BTO30_15335 [Domibacillus antri]